MLFKKLDDLCMQGLESYFAELVKQQAEQKLIQPEFANWLWSHEYCLPILPDFMDGQHSVYKETVVIYIRHCPLGGFSVENHKEAIMAHIGDTLGELPEDITLLVFFSVFTLAEMDKLLDKETSKRVEELGYYSKFMHMWVDSLQRGKKESGLKRDLQQFISQKNC